ncbi:hypothetical protein GEMRC1_006059 [Eukaryota sp. GEM-RC1]
MCAVIPFSLIVRRLTNTQIITHDWFTWDISNFFTLSISFNLKHVLAALEFTLSRTLSSIATLTSINEALSSRDDVLVQTPTGTFQVSVKGQYFKNESSLTSRRREANSPDGVSCSYHSEKETIHTRQEMNFLSESVPGEVTTPDVQDNEFSIAIPPLPCYGNTPSPTSLTSEDFKVPSQSRFGPFWKRSYIPNPEFSPFDETHYKMMYRLLVIDSLSNIVSPLFHSIPPSVLVQSLIGINIGAVSGLSSIVAASCYFIFLLFPPFIDLFPSEASGSLIFSTATAIARVFSEIDCRTVNLLPLVVSLVSTLMLMSLSRGINMAIIMYFATHASDKGTKSINWGVTVLCTLSLFNLFILHFHILEK